jgi:UDP-N-acetylmuramate: L-alanyl-gamma-D-glutamyl-meso-diaminopimelate ligase
VANHIGKLGRRARVIADVESIVRIAAPEMRSGDVVAILSNGGFGGIYEKLPQALKFSEALNAAQAAVRE